MPKNRPLDTSVPKSLEQIVDNGGDETELLRALIKKYCRVIDMTDSARDVRSLGTGIVEAARRMQEIEDKKPPKLENDSFGDVLDEL